MDLTSALKNEIFRPLITIAVPGAVAIGPYILLVGHYVPKVRDFWSTNTYGFGFIVLFAILASGLILEDIGSRIEWCWDRCLNRKIRGRRRAWRHYIQLKTNDEIIGQRFLRTIHIRFKFELSMAPAIFSFTIGLLWLNSIYGFWRACAMAWITLLLCGLVAYLLKESYDSADQLGDLHESITTAVRNEEKKNPPKPAV